MEVEVKIRLPDKAAHDKVAEVFAAGRGETHAQENFFFDGSLQELESQLCVCRLRFYGTDKKAIITVKGKQVLQGGIGRATEVEEDAPDPVAARAWLQDGTAMLSASPLLKGLNEQWRISELRCMGGFRNTRTEFEWDGHTLELDETAYEWGTLYEIECETDKPEELRARLEALLASNGVSYSYSRTTKFANFRNRTLH